MNPIWQQKQLIEFCKDKGIHVTAYSPLGGQSMSNAVLQSEVLEEISKARGKSVAQVRTISLSPPLSLSMNLGQSLPIVLSSYPI
jgi:aryl-alcohol dehydrogenase-like predicted oxidoreductase